MDNLGAAGALTPQVCSADKLIENFTTLVNEIDFSQELKILGIGRFNIRKRGEALQDMLALSIALWRLALRSSFPSDYEHIFESYLTKRRQQTLNKRAQARQLRFQLIARSYVDLLETQGDGNFTELSSHLIKKLKLSTSNYETTRLKLALSIRHIYNFLFQRLI